MSTNRTTQALIDQGESASVELIASARSEEQIAKAVSAFLNTKGGTVVVGLDEQRRTKENITQRELDSLERYLRKTITPPVVFAVSLDETRYGDVIVVEVPKGRDRPYVVEGAVFVRHGTKVRPAAAEVLRKMVEEDTGRPRWERQIAAGLAMEDLNAKLILRTIRAATHNRGMTFADADDDALTLGEMSMMQFGELTNAADVCFGEGVSIRHPQTRVRAVRYETDRAGDRFLDDQLFEGPVLDVYEDAMAFFRRHVAVANDFTPGNMERESKPQYPFAALREGLINALAHRDYSFYSGGASLSVYPGHIEIWNSGNLPAGLSPRKLEQAKHESILVNPDISNVLYMNGLMERIGRGTYTIVQQCKAFKMPPPKWKHSSAGVRLTFFAAAGSSAQPRTAAALAALNSRQRALLGAVKPGESISVSDYLEKFVDEELSARTARRDLTELTQLGAFERVGSARSTAYQRTDKFTDPQVSDAG